MLDYSLQLVSQFHFLRPYWLWLLLPMALLLWLRWRDDRQPQWQDVLPEHLRQALTINQGGWRKQLPLKLLIVIVLLAIVVCAGPTWQRQSSPFGEDKAELLVVLDNSESMLQKDVAPSRLERAKQKVRDLLKLRTGGKTGLIVYAGSAHVAMPMTQDSSVFDPFLAAISPEIMPVKGKVVEKSLPLIDSLLQSQLGSTVLLVTDGVSDSSTRTYKEFFAQAPYQLLILAAGNKDMVSNDPLDIDSLRQLSKATSGRMVEMSVDDSDISELNSLIERNMQLNGDSSMPWQDMGYFLILPMALAMLLWFRKGWLVQWCFVHVVLVGVLFSSTIWTVDAWAETVSVKAKQQENIETLSVWDKTSQWWWNLWLTPDQQGQRLFNQNQYLEAAKHFKDPLRKGTAYYYAGEYQLAHGAFLQMIDDKNLDRQQLGSFYSASALARQREYVAAREMLENLLDNKQLNQALKPDVEHNFTVISGIVEEINRTSEAQAGTSESPEQSLELNDDKPQTAEGADEDTSAELMQKQTLTAEDILTSPEVADKWLKRVESDPKYFLRTKFQIQLRDANSAQDSRSKESP